MFRRKSGGGDGPAHQWETWIDANRQKLFSIGLPPEVYLDESAWLDFLENGHLHWHPSSGFGFLQLSEKQLKALLRFLDIEYSGKVSTPNLLNWLRVRIQREDLE